MAALIFMLLGGLAVVGATAFLAGVPRNNTQEPMSWIEKGQSASFEHQPIDGLFFLHGDVIARHVGQNWTEGQKYPRIAFPSGLKFDLWEGRSTPIVHLFQLHRVVKHQRGL